MLNKIDKILNNKYLGLPLLFLVVFIVFQITFSLGTYPTIAIELFVEYLAQQASFIPDSMFKSLLVDGIISGVGGVLAFIPNIAILFFLLAMLEESGIMYRLNYRINSFMQKIGLDGRSFIPIMMGFGCNVPAVLATKQIESKSRRIITMLVIPFSSCSAKLPIYLLFVSAFFSENQALILTSIYAFGLFIGILTALLLKNTIFRSCRQDSFEPWKDIKIPNTKKISLKALQGVKQYVKKIANIIVISSIIVWALGYFPHNENISEKKQLESSYIGQFGKTLEPIFRPLGYDWKLSVGLISGVTAKEIIISTLSVLYAPEDSNSSANTTLTERIFKNSNIDKKTAYSYMLFVLLYLPCIGTFSAISKIGGTKWAILSTCYTLGIAYLFAFLISLL